MDSPSLVIFCRRPALGVGKQRIAADLGSAVTLELAENLCAATIEDANAWPGPVVLAPDRSEDTDWAHHLLERPCRVISQGKGNLGERINQVDKTLRGTIDTQTLYIGSDAPLLDTAYFAAASEALATNDVVLGPADDGGVTLMGACCAWPDLAHLPWSTAELCNALELTCLKNGLTVLRLENRYDIDLAEDLPRLYEDLRSDLRPARQKFRRWLENSGLVPLIDPR